MKFAELLGLFKAGKATAKSHMKNLLEMAMVDGDFDNTEQSLLKDLAQKHRVSEGELRRIQQHPESVQFELPEESTERFEQFYDLVHMMAVDNRTDDEEVSLILLFAKKFGYKRSRELIDSVAENIRAGLTPVETQKRVNWMLN